MPASPSVPAVSLTVTPYGPAEAPDWDAFVRASRNGTFLFERAYQDYHADRFRDASYVVRDERGALLALLPAERTGTQLRSHGGLTYGGMVVGHDMTLPRLGAVFAATAQQLQRDGIATVHYKTMPAIYSDGPGDDDRYWLFRFGARLVRRDVLSVIDLTAPGPVQERRRRMITRATRAGLTVVEGQAWSAFWAMLAENLTERYGVTPVHTCEEIERLAAAFPHNIRLLTAQDAHGALLAGAVLYQSARVCHVQYNASSPAGRECGALDLVLDRAVAESRGRVRWFDFGVSTEAAGQHLNEGLVAYKESFGARTIVHDFYEWPLREGQEAT